MTKSTSVFFPAPASSVHVPPHPALPFIMLRVLVMLVVIVVLLRPPLGGWSSDYLATPLNHSSAVNPEPMEQAFALWQQTQTTTATFFNAMYNTELYLFLKLFLLLVLTPVLIELLVSAATLIAQRSDTHTHYLRVRVPYPHTGGGKGVTAGDVGDVFRVLQRSLTTTSSGSPPSYLSFTITGAPDTPAALGVVVGGGTPESRSSWSGSLQRALHAHHPEVVVDAFADPLQHAIQQGHEPQVMAWREYVLHEGAAHPLRLPDAADNLAPMVSAVQTAPDVVAAEVQVLVRPRNRVQDAYAQWSAYARRFAALCKRHGRSQDAKVFEEKIYETCFFDVSLRFVVIARTRPLAMRALNEMEGPLGVYTRKIVRRQYWQRVARGDHYLDPDLVDIPPPRPMQTLADVEQGMEQGKAALRYDHDPTPLPKPTHGRIWRSPHLTVRHRVQMVVIALMALAAPLLPMILLRDRLLALTGLITGVSAVVLGLVWFFRAAHGWTTVPSRRRVLQRMPRTSPPPAMLLWQPMWRPTAILSAPELAGLWNLPTPQLGQRVQWLDCRRIAPPPNAIVTNATRDGQIILGAITRENGQVDPIGVPLADLTKVMHMIAGMGAGKSRLLVNMVKQLLDYGVFLFDGKGDDRQGLTWAVQHIIPDPDEQRIMLLDLLDADWVIGLNPLDGVDLTAPGGTDRVLGQVRAVFARLDPETWAKSPGMAQFLDQATLLVLAGEPKPTLAHVAQALLDDAYRSAMLVHCTNREVVSYWETVYPQTTAQQKGSRDALLRRFGQLLVPDLTRRMITSPMPIDLGQAIRDRLIVLAPIPHNTLGGLASAIGMLLFQAMVRAAFSRSGSVQTRALYPIVMDEFQIMVENGATTDVELALSQLRAQNMPLILAHQTFSQVGDLKDLLTVNSFARVMPQTRMPDADTLAKLFPTSPITAADIIGQRPLEHQYVSLGADPFSMEPLQWPVPLPAQTHHAATPSDEAARAWQRMHPDGDPNPLDDLLIILAYEPETIPTTTTVILALERMTDDQWRAVWDRWTMVRQFHRTYLIAHPETIPDRLTRQRWLSRLQWNTPRLLADAYYGRIRRMIDPIAAADTKRAAAAQKTELVLTEQLPSQHPQRDRDHRLMPHETTFLVDRAGVA